MSRQSFQKILIFNESNQPLAAPDGIAGWVSASPRATRTRKEVERTGFPVRSFFAHIAALSAQPRIFFTLSFRFIARSGRMVRNERLNCE
jgi:hypothetical protein